MSQEFIYVLRPSRKQKGKPKGKGTQKSSPSFSEALNRISADLRLLSWWQSSQLFWDTVLPELPSKPASGLCLGLGTLVGQYVAPRAQLVMLIDLCRRLNLGHSSVTLFDPSFSKVDEDGLRELGFTLSSENKRGRHRITSPTLLYMPHCSLILLENLLRENWDKDSLGNMIFVGNDFKHFQDNMLGHELESKAPAINRLARIITSHQVPDCPEFPSCFNNMSLQYIASPSLLPVDGTDEFWNLPPAKEGLDAELI